MPPSPTGNCAYNFNIPAGEGEKEETDDRGCLGLLISVESEHNGRGVIFVLGCANFGRPTLLLLLLLLPLLLLLLLTPVLVCLLLLLLLLFTPVVVCGSVASRMQCLLNIPKMPMVN